MSQDFKFKFDAMRNNSVSDATENNYLHGEKGNEFFPTGSNIRNLCLAWNDGKKLFLNYSYLITAEYLPDDNKITLLFTTHIVSLEGYKLEKLFNAFLDGSAKLVRCMDERYLSIQQKDDAVVTKLNVEPN